MKYTIIFLKLVWTLAESFYLVKEKHLQNTNSVLSRISTVCKTKDGLGIPNPYNITLFHIKSIDNTVALYIILVSILVLGLPIFRQL